MEKTRYCYYRKQNKKIGRPELVSGTHKMSNNYVDHSACEVPIRWLADGMTERIEERINKFEIEHPKFEIQTIWQD